jgi:demethylmenaquinone methyltransferase/2-methoxy-6-polyprenyl-1,4-benzoquinol methylase
LPSLEGVLLEEQKAYYRARAGEYDEWFYRRGRYDRGPENNARWLAEAAEVRHDLERFAPRGDVLELACGTGIWTEHLARHATTLTAVDASPEMLSINRERLGEAVVHYLEADVFDWQPDRAYDVVFFSFWHSHVPPEHFESFWALVRSCLKPEGRAYLVDSLHSDTSIARNHQLDGPQATTSVRKLNDGREFRIVKVFYRPEQLARRLQPMGWQPHFAATANYFLYGWAVPGAKEE